VVPGRHIPPESLVFSWESEWPQIEAWRLQQLLDAGYPVRLAEQLAEAHDVDLHRAVELVEHGCAPLTAAHILL
jgi:hypothetical protein